MEGVRAGFTLIDQPYEEWWNRTSATNHSKPFVVGKRILSSPIGVLRTFKAKSPMGEEINWEEAAVSNRWEPITTWKKLNQDSGYLKIQAWIDGNDIVKSIDEALVAFKDCNRLIVDLRGNPGGNLLMAQRFRNRFIAQNGSIGFIRHTLPNGELSDYEQILAEKNPHDVNWHNKVIFLTDCLTYSSSEDALLGLQGRSNVKVIGQRSGGGSGRMRLIRLLPGYRLTISTALTFDLAKNCIEDAGIPLDHEFECNSIGEDDDDSLIQFAMTL